MACAHGTRSGNLRGRDPRTGVAGALAPVRRPSGARPAWQLDLPVRGRHRRLSTGHLARHSWRGSVSVDGSADPVGAAGWANVAGIVSTSRISSCERRHRSSASRKGIPVSATCAARGGHPIKSLHRPDAASMPPALIQRTRCHARAICQPSSLPGVRLESAVRPRFGSRARADGPSTRPRGDRRASAIWRLPGAERWMWT